jgi:hypothetical protein
VRPLNDVVRDLLTAVCRETVHDQNVRGRESHQPLV